REIFPISAMLVALVDLAVGSSVLIALMVWYRIPPSGYIVLLPVVVLVQMLFTVAVSLFIAMANLFYRDVKYIFEVVVTISMFATSVLYPFTDMKGTLGAVLKLNPMTWIIDTYRNVIFGAHTPDFSGFGLTAVASVVLLALIWLSFHRS